MATSNSRSQLTRAVFRAIVDNRPYVVPECRARFQHTFAKPTRRAAPYTQRRNRMFGAIFGTLDRGFEGAKNTPKNLELALAKLVDLVRARRTQSRGPSDPEVLDAFRFLFLSRLDSQRRLTRNEVYLATEVFKHLQDKGLVVDSTDKTTLARSDLDVILQTLAVPSTKEKFRSDTRALASMVFAALASTTDIASIGSGRSEAAALLPVYATVLARTGSAVDALKILKQPTAQNVRDDVRVWIEILKGLASEGRPDEFDRVMEDMRTQLKTQNASTYEELILFLAENDNLNEARRVYKNQLDIGVEPTTLELETLVELCIRTNQLDYGKPIAQALEARASQEAVLGRLLMWAAATIKDAKMLRLEIERLLQTTAPEFVTMAPFTDLIRFGYSNGQPEMAAAILDVAQAIGLQPDGKFYALQLQQAVQQKDLSAAANAFEELIRQDMAGDNSDVEALNHFVVALAFSAKVDYNLLMRIIDYLLEKNADFNAESLAGVCRVFLQRDELDDLTGLLRHRVDFYPAADRARISVVFQEFIKDPSVREQRAFNAYELFRVAFPETPMEQRLPIMQSFFDRNRSDLACLVFGHMRQREDIEARPTADAYAKCFAGIAQCRDVDGLQMVFNMLKLDLEVELTTKVRNGLMLAYIACQMPYTAMIDHFWKIMDSREGPSYSTFEVALRACESWVPHGGYEARKIMAIVQAWNLEITKELYDSYVGAIAGQSEFESTIELIEEMENEVGERPDVYTIGAFYNAIPWQYRKDEVEKWAKKVYPDLWEELLTFGDVIDEEWEIRYFKIDRTIDIEDGPLFTDGKYDSRISRAAVEALEPPPETPATEQAL